MDEDHLMNVIEITKLIDLNKQIVEQENEVELELDDVLQEVADRDTVMEEVTSKITCYFALVTLYEHNETPGGSIYWEPHVQGIPIPVEGTYYDTVDEAIDMYTKYAQMGGFEIKKSGQRLTKSGAVKHKYTMCNREGVPKENSELVAMFWADEVAKCNYKEFGDIVSFDATFNSNKYNMKFVPFIGIDNHGKCVTLGSGMLLLEDTTSYTWLPKAFINAFTKKPTMIVTYQDGAMKRAIKAVFTKAKHKLCMWHIMQKIPSKICKEIYDETDFKDRFDKIVWNMFIEPLKFEEKWAKLIEDFGLQNHKWMTKMFNLREIWILAYFIDSPLFGLMRTTSRSKSKNSFFKSFTSPGATLVSFMMSYESAMERQRYRQKALNFKTIDAAPKCETMLAIERHAARVYTRTIFLLVQTEIIEGCWSCTIQDLKINEGCETVIIRDKKLNDNRALNTKKGKDQEKKIGTVTETMRDYKVLRIIEDGSVNRDINVIPKQYILRRWTRDIIPPDLRRQRNRYGKKYEGKMGAFVEKLKVLMEEVKADVPNPPSRNTRDVIGGIFSISKPNQIVVQNPTNVVNKGERLKSEREKALKVRAKKLKVCGYFKEKTNEHTKTTFPLNPKAKKNKKATPTIDVLSLFSYLNI
ncbi:FAR1-related sequence 5-like protein [Tanacetum coccineum]